MASGFAMALRLPAGIARNRLRHTARMQDIENGLRRFVITGDPRHPEAFESRLERFPEKQRGPGRLTPGFETVPPIPTR